MKKTCFRGLLWRLGRDQLRYRVRPGKKFPGGQFGRHGDVLSKVDGFVAICRLDIDIGVFLGGRTCEVYIV